MLAKAIGFPQARDKLASSEIIFSSPSEYPIDLANSVSGLQGPHSQLFSS
jgi:hypothetical protein